MVHFLDLGGSRGIAKSSGYSSDKEDDIGRIGRRKIKPVSVALVLKLVTCACFRKFVFLLVICFVFDRFSI